MAFDADEPLVHPWVRVDRSVAALVATLGATRHMSMVDLKQLESTRVWKMNPQKKTDTVSGNQTWMENRWTSNTSMMFPLPRVATFNPFSSSETPPTGNMAGENLKKKVVWFKENDHTDHT